MTGDLHGQFEELMTLGERMVLLGGFDYSGYNARLEGSYLEWRKACLQILDRVGPIGFPGKSKILADQNGNHFYQSSAHVILSAVTEVFDKLQKSPDLVFATNVSASSAAKELSVGTSTILTDSPDEGAVTHHMPDAILGLIGSATREVMITNAYIIPGQKAVDGLKAMNGRGVRLRILTNSLASHDVPAVNSHYKEWRKPLIEAGVELHEMRPDAAIRKSITDTPPVESEFMGLHSKGIVIDRARVFIGPAKLDPRSFRINSEMGIIIDSPDLAGKLGDIMHRDMEPENSWSVELDAKGNPRWDWSTRTPTSRSPASRISSGTSSRFPAPLRSGSSG